MAEQDGGSLVYQVDIETAKMVTGSRQAAVVLGEMEKQANRSCSLTLQNPLNNNIGFLYNTTEFPGLANA